MSRIRLGAALMMPQPWAEEIQGLRRACGDHGKMAPHLTLVPPVNVRESDVDLALKTLQAAASKTRPFTLTLGPPATFMPDNPVLYLKVGGDLDELLALRERVFVGPLSRDLSWPFTPHVTICDSGEPDRLQAAMVGLADYKVEVGFDRVYLLHEVPHNGHHHRWVPFLDASFAEPVVVGRGGFELELIASELLDPWTKTTIESWMHESTKEAESTEDGETALTIEESLVIKAQHDGELVGVLTGYRNGHVGIVKSCVIKPSERRHGIASHLMAQFISTLVAKGVSQISAYASLGPGRQWLDSMGFEDAHSGGEHLHLIRWV